MRSWFSALRNPVGLEILASHFMITLSIPQTYCPSHSPKMVVPALTDPDIFFDVLGPALTVTSVSVTLNLSQ